MLKKVSGLPLDSRRVECPESAARLVEALYAASRYEPAEC